jgi:protein-S-isoprenylcysteine O-methyltransferase Ste14
MLAFWQALVAVSLFVPAGTLVWPGAWIFLTLFIGGMFAMMAWLKRRDPALFAERTRLFRRPGQSGWDKAISLAIGIVWYAWIALMGLDMRWSGGPHTPAWLLAAGAALIGAGYLLVGASFKANTFAAVAVRLQSERGQKVADTGPYAWVRHPIYSASVLTHLGTLFLLGSWRGAAGVIALVLLLGLRAVLEERMLRNGLAGYADYIRRVRWRLVPGIW